MSISWTEHDKHDKIQIERSRGIMFIKQCKSSARSQWVTKSLSWRMGGLQVWSGNLRPLLNDCYLKTRIIIIILNMWISFFQHVLKNRVFNIFQHVLKNRVFNIFWKTYAYAHIIWENTLQYPTWRGIEGYVFKTKCKYTRVFQNRLKLAKASFPNMSIIRIFKMSGTPEGRKVPGYLPQAWNYSPLTFQCASKD